MCRFTFYVGPELHLASLVTDPVNSLIHQSFEAGEREEPLNGDGFGVAWYPPPPQREPGLFRAVTPAWNNSNLQSLARVVKSSCILAHVRAATRIRSIGEVNCHPFVVGRFAFMHNGDIAAFSRLRRKLLEKLSDESFASIHGQTDSEHLFALFLDRVGGPTADPNPAQLSDALTSTMREAMELSRQYANGEAEQSSLNIAVTNGSVSAVTRYTSDSSYDGESLYVDIGRRYVCEGNVCRMIAPDAAGAAVIVSSERLSSDPGWSPVPRNHMVLIDADRKTTVQPLDLV